MLDGINFRDCGLCLLLFSDCTADGCAKTFYADQGTVEITAIGRSVGQRFALSTHGVVFREVTINWEGDYTSTPVPGGETWCLDGYGFDEEIEDAMAALCGRSDVTCVGETVTDFSLTNCETGMATSMRSVAAGRRALWLVLTSGTCPACSAYVPEAVARGAADAARGLELAVVVGENASGGPPSLDYCRSYASRAGGNPRQFFIDNDGTNSFATTFTYLWPYIDAMGNIGLPWQAVINAETFEYVHGDGAGTDMDAVINSLLSP